MISLKTDLEWAPYSPDLSPPDFFLLGYLKDRVYAGKQLRAVPQEMHGAKWSPSRTHAVERREKGQRP